MSRRSNKDTGPTVQLETYEELTAYTRSLDLAMKDKSSVFGGMRIRFRCRFQKKEKACKISGSALVSESGIEFRLQGEHLHEFAHGLVPLIKESQLQPEEFDEMLEAVDDLFNETHEADFTNNQNYTNDSAASLKLCNENIEVNNDDDFLGTLLQNQRMMLDAMFRLEKQLKSIHRSQGEFSRRLKTLENQTGSVLNFASEQREVTRHIQKAVDTIETRVDSFISANDISYSNPALVSTNNSFDENMLSTRAIENSWATTNDAADVGGTQSSSREPVSYQSGELQQQLDQFCSSFKAPRNRSSRKSSWHRRGNQNTLALTGAHLQLDPTDPTVGCIGNNPSLPISVYDYSRIWLKSGTTPMNLLFALLLRVYGGPENLKHLSWAGNYGRQSLRDDPAFASCVSQVSLQFPAFKMTKSVALRVGDRLGRLRKKRDTSKNLKAAVREDGNCPSPSSAKFLEKGVLNLSELVPMTEKAGTSSMETGMEDILLAKSEVENDD